MNESIQIQSPTTLVEGGMYRYVVSLETSLKISEAIHEENLKHLVSLHDEEVMKSNTLIYNSVLPLDYAAECGKYYALSCLHYLGYEGSSAALHSAMKNGQTRVVNWLLKHRSNDTYLLNDMMDALRYKHLDTFIAFYKVHEKEVNAYLDICTHLVNLIIDLCVSNCSNELKYVYETFNPFRKSDFISEWKRSCSFNMEQLREMDIAHSYPPFFSHLQQCLMYYSRDHNLNINTSSTLSKL